MNKAFINSKCTITRLGTIHDDDGELQENAIELSEKNFRTLLSLIPRIEESNAVHIDCLRLRAKINELSYKTDRTRKEYNNILESELAYSLFVEDIKEFNTPNIKIVGKINLEDV